MFRSANSIFSRPLITIAAIVTVSCTLVEPEPGSDDVRIITAEPASHCKFIGRVSAQVLDEVLFMDRSDSAISENLDTLAKNEATRLDGNAVMAVGTIDGGRRDYNVYDCQR
jgi:hypothetical protein